MKIFYLIRRESETHTDSIIAIAGETFESFALPYLGNKNNVSCVADGIYEVFVDMKNNGNYRSVVELRPKTINGYTRSQCQFHYASKVSHLAGCEGMYSLEDENKLMQTVLKDGYTHLIIKTINSK